MTLKQGIASSGYAEILARINDRAVDAILGKGRVRSVSLRQDLARRLYTGGNLSEAFVADPVFEAARVWQRADVCLDDLAGNLLEPDLVAALDSKLLEGGQENTRRWPRTGEDVAPYTHQLRAWQEADRAKSYMVTSGTGSGKTECFMIPMLNDLLRAYKPGNTGTQAIVLYPLNALIDSQKERLSAWMDPLADRLSYALYNRHLPENVPGPKKRGAEIRDRKTMRASPPSLLVTNVTMLEYMLMRAQDRGLLEKSQGSLRWIVLDEAHSYVGAQAAEMALLLRRVREAFGVAPEDVRLAATSATIGEGEEARETLRRFLADLAGLKPEQVEIIEGQERATVLPDLQKDTALSLDKSGASPSELWHQLAPHPRIRNLREKMRNGGVDLRTAGDLLGIERDTANAAGDTFKLLEAAGQAEDPATGATLAPWRMHVFHRAQGGLWACVDPDCPDKGPELTYEGNDWPFGQVHLTSRDRCTCKAPTYEIGACDECGTPWLIADVSNETKHRFLRLAADQSSDDEYILDVEPDIDSEDNQNVARVAERVVVACGDEHEVDFLRLSDGALFERPDKGDRCVPVRLADPLARGCCDKSSHRAVIARPQRFGAPFLMGNALPLLLEGAKTNPSENPVPFGGRRLLSFTDSRQGTARFSAKLQQEAERTLTRAVIYHSVCERSGDPDRAAQLETEIAGLQPLVAATPSLAGILAERQEALAEAKGGLKPVSWDGLVTQLAQNEEHRNFACPVWKDRPAKGDDALSDSPKALAELFLYRELFRRPRLQNNVETMGLARLVFPALIDQARINVPVPLVEIGHDSTVWADLLHAAIDTVFRSNLAIDLPENPVEFRHWIAPRSMVSMVMEPGTDRDSANGVRNPKYFPNALSNRSGLVKLVYRLIGANPDIATDVDRVDAVLTAIWDGLRKSKVIKQAASGGWRLDLTQVSIAPVEIAYQCPVTHRLLPYAPAGISMNAIDDEQLVEQVQMPQIPFSLPTGLSQNQRLEIRDWLRTDMKVSALRIEGVWTNLHDRTAEFSPFFRAQEHSAQIDRGSLQTYEQEFMDGQINILNCSTTMEMGVDIPDVGLVVNTNVPPAPTNYRQRVGRAGRRGEPWALAFTFCKDLPLDNMIFRDPSRLLQAEVAAPRVQLDSTTLVQRHVNAMLLGLFLRQSGGVNIKTSMASFIGATPELDEPFLEGNQADAFHFEVQSDWSDEAKVKTAIETLVRGTCLEGAKRLAAQTAADFIRFLGRWRGEYVQLLEGQVAYPDNEPAYHLYRKRAKRMRDEFMMTELAKRGFTPSYGFPVDVVSFDHAGSDSEVVGPTRQLEVAVREYSPGCEVVIDGLVHRSEGVLPTWGNRNDPSEVEDLRTLFMCRKCSLFGTSLHETDACPQCGEPVICQELLRPSGFLGTRKPHSAYEQLAFVPPDVPRVSAEPERWVTLPDPSVGRYRIAREGHVLVTSSGEHGQGYAICITCGRAEAENNSENPALPAGMADHKPLQKLRNNPRHDGKCPAVDEASRRIRRRVRLGTEMATDVFELQLEALPNTKSGQEKALCLASAIREALAGRLGVDAETMGITVAPSVRDDTASRMSLFLFDKASGGSGFAIAAENDLPGLLSEAAKRLDCVAKCENGCPECVLRRDLQYGAKMNRIDALELLLKDVVPKLEMPDRLAIFGAATKAITLPFAQWASQKSISGSLKEVTVFLTDQPEFWDVSEWSGRDLIRDASQRDIPVKIVLRTADFPTLEMSHKLDLARLTTFGNTSLHGIADLPEVLGTQLIASVNIDGTDYAVASPNEGASRINRHWGQTEEGPLLIGAVAVDGISPPLSIQKVAELNQARSAQKDVTTELDGSIRQFGTKFWKLVCAMHPQSFAAGRHISQVTYSDRYMRSPLTSRLLFEVWRKMPLKDAETKLSIVSERLEYDGRRAHQLHHNWEDDKLRRAVLAEMFPSVQLNFGAKADCPHARFFKITFADQSTLDISLDQGFGAWRESESRLTRFAQDMDARKLSASLSSSKFSVALQEQGKFASPIWLRW